MAKTFKILFGRTLAEQMITAIIILGALLCIFTPKYIYFRVLTRYTVHIMMLYLIASLLLLAFGKQRQMLVTMSCCAMLCFYLKGATNHQFRLPNRTDEPFVRVAHFNLSSSSGDYSPMLHEIEKSNADIVSLQEVTPDWDLLLKDSLEGSYPYQCKVIGTDVYGMCIFSKLPINQCDTFYCEDIPNLSVNIQVRKNRSLCFVGSYIAPPLFSAAYETLKKQLSSISTYVLRINTPVITIGDYNVVPWSNEMQQFKDVSHLNDSRRGFMPTYANGVLSLFDIPVDHIFFSNKLKCVDFETLGSHSSGHMGIMGVYQFTYDTTNVAKAIQ